MIAPNLDIPLPEPQAAVLLNRSPLDVLPGSFLIDLTITKQSRTADHLSLRLGAWDPDLNRALWLDTAVIGAGSQFSVALGYGGVLSPVFDGELVDYELALSGTERPVLTINACDKLHRLGRGKREPAASAATLADAVGEIADRHNLKARIEGAEALEKKDLSQRSNESDLDYLTGFAADLDHELRMTEEGELLVQKVTPNEVVLLAPELIDFTGRAHPASQHSRVEVVSAAGLRSAQNPDNFDRAYGGNPVPAAGEMAASGVSSRIVLMSASPEQAQALAEAELTKMRRRYLHVDCMCFGRTDVVVTSSVVIAGVSPRFDGPYRVEQVRHSFSPSQGFRTRLSLEGTYR